MQINNYYSTHAYIYRESVWTFWEKKNPFSGTVQWQKSQTIISSCRSTLALLPLQQKSEKFESGDEEAWGKRWTIPLWSNWKVPRASTLVILVNATELVTTAYVLPQRPNIPDSWKQPVCNVFSNRHKCSPAKPFLINILSACVNKSCCS